jgi:hypothetical protein
MAATVLSNWERWVWSETSYRSLKLVVCSAPPPTSRQNLSSPHPRRAVGAHSSPRRASGRQKLRSPRPVACPAQCRWTAGACSSPHCAGCRSCRPALPRSPEARAHVAANAVDYLEARVFGAVESAPATRADRSPASMPLVAWISVG